VSSKKKDMNTKYFRIKIIHEIGVIANETFINDVQFKLFLKAINGCLQGTNNLTFYNGTEFLIHIPNTILKECIIFTSTEKISDGEKILEDLRSSLEQKI